MDITHIVKLTERSWAPTILALLHNGVPARQAPLIAASGAGRSSFLNSLVYLKEAGLLEKNPGHGHPMRPEYRLTNAGKAAAEVSHRLLLATPQPDRTLFRRRWSLPVLAALPVPRGFNAVKQSLPGITDRALSQSLRSMEDQGWLDRRINGEIRPPGTLYSGIGVGATLIQILNGIETADGAA